MAGEMVVGDCVAVLTKLQDAGVVLTTRSLQLMNIGKAACRKPWLQVSQGLFRTWQLGRTRVPAAHACRRS